jgi:hypothetical protein
VADVRRLRCRSLCAREKNDYAINCYAFEAQRHFGILDARLAKQKYMLGDTYTIVDMAVWGWARGMPIVLGEAAWAKFPNLKRLIDEISTRPAAQRAAGLKDKHKFKRNGRRSPQGDVPAHERKSRLKAALSAQLRSLAAIFLASSLVMRFAAARLPGSDSK